MYRLKKNQFSLALISALVCFFVLCLLFFPEECYKAAANGVNTWINIVLPALLPFFIGAELLIGLGVIHFTGTLLEPFMRPVFKVPGLASFVYILSITSGYPVGVKLTCKLREQGMCSKQEAQRMLTFCSTSGPLFMIGAVAIGMLHSALAGSIIAISHYVSSIIIGVIFSFFLKDSSYAKHTFTRLPGIKTALKAMYHKRVEDGRPLGILLGDAVKESINTLLAVGGFITLFSVVIEIISITGVLDYISRPIINLLNILLIPSELVKPVISGLLEITIGSRRISLLSSVPLINKITATSFIIGWSGFSIHAQATSFISKTDLSTVVYIIAKFFHGIFAAILSFILGTLMLSDQTQQVFLPKKSCFITSSFAKTLILSTEILILIFAITFSLIIICKIISRVFGFNINKS